MQKWKWLIASLSRLFSKLFKLYCCSQYTYPCFPGASFTNVSYSIHAKPLGPIPNERKVVGGFGKKNRVSTGVRKPGNTYMSPTTMI